MQSVDIRFACENCGQHLAAAQKMADGQVTCPHCKFQQTVPTHSTLVSLTTPQPTQDDDPFPFTVVRIRQNTEEWLEWRNQGIGASDAAIIMGDNPWKTPDELFERKLGLRPEEYQNSAMARGHELEPRAGDRYTEITGKQVWPACLERMDHPWLKASLDGISKNGRYVVEIKCGDSAYRRTKETGEAPSYYVAQLQHILMVTGLSSIDFFCWLPRRKGVLIVVHRDDAYIEKLFQKEYEFWQRVMASRSVQEPKQEPFSVLFRKCVEKALLFIATAFVVLLGFYVLAACLGK